MIAAGAVGAQPLQTPGRLLASQFHDISPRCIQLLEFVLHFVVMKTAQDTRHGPFRVGDKSLPDLLHDGGGVGMRHGHGLLNALVLFVEARSFFQVVIEGNGSEKGAPPEPMTPVVDIEFLAGLNLPLGRGASIVIGGRGPGSGAAGSMQAGASHAGRALFDIDKGQE